MPEEVEDSFLDEIEIELESELHDHAGEEEHAPEVQNQNVMVKVSLLNIGQKIKLAILDNREARALLVRDPNKIVSKAVLKKPSLTESGVAIFIFIQ